MAKNLIIRILGNELDGLHYKNQTYNNLKFTLEHEQEFKDVTKVFILNKIINRINKKKIIKLLNKNNIEYIDIPFNKADFKQFKIDNNWEEIELFFLEDKTHKYCADNRQHVLNILKPFNQYIINNNGMRNLALDYGKENNYEWIFVLDSNNFILENDYECIFSKLNSSTEYIILPTKRLTDNNLENSDIFNSEKLSELNFHEPQIAFKNTSNVIFNKEIPYGASPKVELLQVLGIKGKWDNWKDYNKWYGINCRDQIDVNSQKITKIIRLQSSNNSDNNTTDNWYKRIIGLYQLIDSKY